MRNSLTLAFALSILLPAAAQNAPPPQVDDVKVDKAIQAGVAYLKTKTGDLGEGRGCKRELVLLTLVHAGIAEKDPVFQELFKAMLEDKIEFTYRAALQAMILEEVDRVKYQGRLWQCGQFLVDNQAPNGQWSYGEPSLYAEESPVPSVAPRKDVASSGGVKVYDTGALPPFIHRKKPEVRNRYPVTKKRDGKAGDNSNTQYAALGLRACHDSGITLPADVVDRGMKWWRDSQKDEKDAKEDRLDLQGGGEARAPGKGATTAGQSLVAEPQGWCYSKHAHKAYGSMTAGATGGLCIYNYIKDNDGGIKQSWKRDKDVHEGLQWLAKNFLVTGNPGPYEHAKDGKGENGPHQHYYYLYGLERAGMLYGTEVLNTHAWYPEGAKFLIENQKANGSWDSTAVETCFAILFLRRATRPLVASEAAGKR